MRETYFFPKMLFDYGLFLKKARLSTFLNIAKTGVLPYTQL